MLSHPLLVQPSVFSQREVLVTYLSSGLAHWESDSEVWGHSLVFIKCSFVCLSFACIAPADPLEEGSRQL